MNSCAVVWRRSVGRSPLRYLHWLRLRWRGRLPRVQHEGRKRLHSDLLLKVNVNLNVRRGPERTRKVEHTLLTQRLRGSWKWNYTPHKNAYDGWWMLYVYLFAGRDHEASELCVMCNKLLHQRKISAMRAGVALHQQQHQHNVYDVGRLTRVWCAACSLLADWSCGMLTI